MSEDETKRTCEHCSNGAFVEEKVTDSVRYRGDELKISYDVLACRRCGKYLFVEDKPQWNAQLEVRKWKNRHSLLFGGRLETIRTGLGHDIDKMAEVLDIKPNTVLKWEKDLLPQSESVDLKYRSLAEAMIY